MEIDIRQPGEDPERDARVQKAIDIIERFNALIMEIRGDTPGFDAVVAIAVPSPENPKEATVHCLVGQHPPADLILASATLRHAVYEAKKRGMSEEDAIGWVRAGDDVARAALEIADRMDREGEEWKNSRN